MRFLTPERVRNINPTLTEWLVEDAYEYPHGSLREKNNAARIAHPRHLLCYLLVKNGMSFPAVGRFLGKNHTTVIHSVQVIVAQMEEDESVRALVERLTGEMADEKFTKPKERLRSVLTPLDRTPLKPPLSLPNVANGIIRGTEDLDELIRSGRGDSPRLRIEDLDRKKRHA